MRSDKSVLINVRVPPAMKRDIDHLVQLGEFRSGADFIYMASFVLLEKYKEGRIVQTGLREELETLVKKYREASS